MLIHPKIKKKINNNFYIFNNKEMKQFVCGNAKRKQFVFQESQLILSKRDKNVITQNNYDKDCIDKEKGKFSPSKIVHGFGGIVIPGKDLIAFSMHTSGNSTKLHSLETNNILVNESLNPIKFVNSVQFMKISDFNKYYKITKPETMLNSLRYGKNAEHDMLHCSFRAFFMALTSSEPGITVFIDEEISKSELFIDNSKNILTPAEVVLSRTAESADLANNMIIQIKDDIALLSKDEGMRLRFLEEVKERGLNLLNNNEV